MNIHNVNLLLVVPTRVDGWDSIDGVSNVGQYGMDLSFTVLHESHFNIFSVNFKTLMNNNELI